MFRVVPRTEVWWPVVIEVPVDGGKTEPHECEALFALLPAEELDRAKDETRDDIEFLARVVRGWRQVAGETGEPLACTDEERRRLFGITYVRMPFLNAFFAANSGRAASRKNS